MKLRYAALAYCTALLSGCIAEVDIGAAPEEEPEEHQSDGDDQLYAGIEHTTMSTWGPCEQQCTRNERICDRNCYHSTGPVGLCEQGCCQTWLQCMKDECGRTDFICGPHWQQ